MFDVRAPTARYSDDQPVNLGNNFVVVDPYCALTHTRGKLEFSPTRLPTRCSETCGLASTAIGCSQRPTTKSMALTCPFTRAHHGTGRGRAVFQFDHLVAPQRIHGNGGSQSAKWTQRDFAHLEGNPKCGGESVVTPSTTRSISGSDGLHRIIQASKMVRESLPYLHRRKHDPKENCHVKQSKAYRRSRRNWSSGRCRSTRAAGERSVQGARVDAQSREAHEAG